VSAINQRDESDRMRNPVKAPGLKKQIGRERFAQDTTLDPTCKTCLSRRKKCTESLSR
jgi:hypothetical protein